MLDYVRDGDVLVVSEYARLARSSTDLLRIVKELQDKGVEIISLREKLDTTTPEGRFMLTVFAGLSEFEREMIWERQREGIAIAKAAGKYKGGKPIPAVITKNWNLLRLQFFISYFKKCRSTIGLPLYSGSRIYYCHCKATIPHL